MEYTEIPEFSDQRIREDLKSNDPEKIIKAMLSTVLYSANYKLSVETTQLFFKSTNENIRGCSIECIAHIARLWNKLPTDFIAIANSAAGDESSWVRGKAGDTLDDLEIFIKDFKRLDPGKWDPE